MILILVITLGKKKHIKMKDNVLWKDELHRIAQCRKFDEVKQNLKQMIDFDIIIYSNPYSSNVIVDRKLNGEFRFCIILRHINHKI